MVITKNSCLLGVLLLASGAMASPSFANEGGYLDKYHMVSYSIAEPLSPKVERGYQLLRQGKPDVAFTVFSRIVSTPQDCAMVWAGLGEAAAAIDKVKSLPAQFAVKDWRRSLLMASAYFHKRNQFPRWSKRWLDYQNLFLSYSSRLPDSDEPCVALLSLDAQRLLVRRKTLEKLSVKYPKNVGVRSLLAVEYLAKEVAVSVGSDEAGSIPEKAHVRHYNVPNRLDDGMRELQAVLKQDPSFPPAHYYVAKAYYMLGRKEDAKREAAWFVKSVPQDHPLVKFASYYLQHGDYNFPMKLIRGY